MRTLRVLEQALALARKHVRVLLPTKMQELIG
jgi:hypothetical protein